MDNHNDFKPKEDFNECKIRAICATTPTLSAIQEVILMHLKELAFYLLELKKMEAAEEIMQHCLLGALSIIVANSTLSEEQYKELILSLDKNLSQTKQLYIETCKKMGKSPHFLKTHFKHTKDFSLNAGIKKGEKYIKDKAKFQSAEQKNLSDIMLLFLKSVYIRAFEMRELGEIPREECLAILNILNSMNFPDTPMEKIKENIEKTADIFNQTINRLISKKEEKYGKTEPTEVSFSTTPGKAIMVVGCNINELDLILKATEGRGIDVYTHGLDMLMAHTFPKFKNYKHLVGHFGQWHDNALVDYAMFPGSILMTRHAVQKSEYFCRGRLFTTDLVPSRGVIKIIDNNYEPLIQSALTAKGFRKGQQRPSKNIGFSVQELFKKIDKVMDRVEKGEIKHIYVIGLLNNENEHKEYFEKFFKLMPEDCFAFSLAINKSGKNILHVDSIYDYALITRLLEKLAERKPLSKIDLSIFLTSCNRHTVATILSLKKLGIKNIYMSKCPPNLANPSLIESLKKNFGIMEFLDPKEDIEKTLKTKDEK